MPAVWVVRAKIIRMDGKRREDISGRVTFTEARKMIEAFKRQKIDARMEEVGPLPMKRVIDATPTPSQPRERARQMDMWRRG